MPAEISGTEYAGYRNGFRRLASKPNEVYASIMPSTEHRVWGVAYLCNPKAFEQLDVHEGVLGGHYQRQQLELMTQKGESLLAEVYVAGADYVVEESKPSHEYLGHLLAGAEVHGLPYDYILNIKRIAGVDAE
ncbi:MAG: gamma-glutamylcyclotransferase (GGCT)/AIG2-like uncharacterized protein YtfP [Mariniblastus sp.]